MSLNISLIEYKSCKNDRLYEEDSQIIESAYLSPALLEIIKDKYPLCETEVFEEKESSESSIIENISENNIHDIKELLEHEFVRLIEAKESQNLKLLISPNSLFETIEKFRILTNIHHIFWLKKMNFSKRSDVLIKIG